MICPNPKCKKEIPDAHIYCGYCGKKAVRNTARKPRTRANGAGSAYKRGKTWTAEVSVPIYVSEEKKDPKTGEIKTVKVIKHISQRKGGFPTKTAALAYVPELKKPRDEKKQRAEITFIDVYEAVEERYKKRIADGTVSCHTLASYRAAKNNFAGLHFMPFQEIGIDEIQECVDGVPGKSSREKMRTLIHTMYDYAIPRHMAKIDIGEYIEVTGTMGTFKALPEDVIELIGRHVWSIDYAGIIYVLCYTGYRPTELFTRKQADYDRANQLIRGGIKTQAGIDKIVTISPKIIPLVEFYASQGNEYIFCRKDGSQLKADYFIDQFYEVLERLGIQPIPKTGEKPLYVPYSCRHSFSNKLKNAPGSDIDKAALFGHADYKTTQKFYQQGEVEKLREITDSL